MGETVDQETQAKPEPAPGLAASSEDGGLEIIDQMADEWRELCSGIDDGQPFYRPEWIRAYIRAFLPRAKVRIISVRRGNRLRAVLPLVLLRESFCGIPCTKLRSAVKAHAFRFDMTCCTGTDREAAIGAIWQQLAGQRDWQILEFRNVLPGAALEQLLQLAAAEGYPSATVPLHASPYVPLERGPSALSALPRSGSLSKTLRQVKRKLGAVGSLRLTRVERADATSLQRLYTLEASGWKGREGSAIASSRASRQFFDEIAEQGERFGYLCLYLLELNDQLVAAHFGLCYQGRYFSPKIAFDEGHKDWMGGHLIVSLILPDCVERGIIEYDITGSADDWKMRWTAETRPSRMLLVFRNTPYGRLLHTLQFRGKSLIKRMLRREKPTP